MRLPNPRLPKQRPPVVRTVSTAHIGAGVHPQPGVYPSIDWGCILSCGTALAECAISPGDTVQCLISKGLSQCVRCL